MSNNNNNYYYGQQPEQNNNTTNGNNSQTQLSQQTTPSYQYPPICTQQPLYQQPPMYQQPPVYPSQYPANQPYYPSSVQPMPVPQQSIRNDKRGGVRIGFIIACLILLSWLIYENSQIRIDFIGNMGGGMGDAYAALVLIMMPFGLMIAGLCVGLSISVFCSTKYKPFRIISLIGIIGSIFLVVSPILLEIVIGLFFAA